MRKAVVLSLDALFEEDIRWYRENDPFMRDFLADSICCTQVKTVFPALTYPAHVTLMTGCDPVHHGIGQNQPYQPEKESVMRSWYWDVAAVQRPTLFHRVKEQGGTCAGILWPVTGKHPAIRYNFPEVLALPGENQVLKMLRYGTPGWILRMELKHGKERVSTKEPYLSQYAVVLLKDLLKNKHPDLTMVHLVDLDETRHHTGTRSPESREALKRLSGLVREVWETMQAIPAMQDALLILVSDHGQEDISRTILLRKMLEELGLDQDFGVQSNGMTACFFPKHEKACTGQLAAAIAPCQEAYGIARIYTRQDLDAMQAVAGPVLAVEAAPLVVFSDQLEEKKREKATHGFGPGHPSENCLFAVCGKGVEKGKSLPAMPMRNVAPTIAGLMGIRFEGADGVDVLAE